MSPRSRGEGTVFQDGDGWVARVELPIGPDGKRRRRKKRARTKTEARAALKELQKEIELVDNPSGLRRTVAEAVERHVSSRPTHNRSRATVENDASRARTIVRILGQRQIGKLTVEDCDRFLQNLAAGDYSKGKPLRPDTVRRFRALLIDSLRNEQRVGNLARNVAELSEMPVFTDRPIAHDEDGDSSTSVRRILSLDEYRTVHDQASGAVKIIIDLCGRCGLRPSEARALRWSRVDLEEQTIRIDAQMNSKNVLTAPKTRRSRRTVAIDAETLALLQNWREQQDMTRQAAGTGWDAAHDFVASTGAGTAQDGSNLRRAIARLCEAAGMEQYVPYELRHTAITFQLDQGAEIWEVADWAGTSERMIELIYRHRTSRVSRLAPLPLNSIDRVPSEGPNGSVGVGNTSAESKNPATGAGSHGAS